MSEGEAGGPPRAPDATLASRLGHRFRDPALLELALTHPSAAFERDGTRGNERLEFLGDAALDLAVALLLYETHPDWPEGDLTRARAALVNGRSLAEGARALGLADYVVLGRTEERGGGRSKQRILASGLEAVLGALYLDAGLAPVRELARRLFGEAIASGEAVRLRDPKTRLQEWAHAELGETPRYRAVTDTGVEEAEDRFTVEVAIGDAPWGRASGRTKRAAERAAAERALARARAPAAASGEERG